MTGGNSVQSSLELMEDSSIIRQRDDPLLPHEKWMIQMDNALSRGTTELPELPDSEESTPKYQIIEGNKNIS